MIRIIVSIWTFLVGLFRARGAAAPSLELAASEPTSDPSSTTIIKLEVPADVSHDEMQHAAVVASVNSGQPVLIQRAEPVTVGTIGDRVVAEAVRFWTADIYDPAHSDKSVRANTCRAYIDTMLRACGWTWEIPYLGDGQVEWCGIFAAACWRAAGIDPTWLATYFASTYRLDTWARYDTFDATHPNHKPQTGPYRMLAELDQRSTSLPFAPQAGDILTVGNGSLPYGNHITIVVSYDPVRKVFSTISGNGGGIGPDGKRRQGVVKADFALGGPGYCARRLIRPAPADQA